MESEGRTIADILKIKDKIGKDEVRLVKTEGKKQQGEEKGKEEQPDAR